MPKRLTSEDFVRRSKVIHGDVYDYSDVQYSTTHIPVEIGCRTHGKFLQLPESHLRGCGCPKCANVYSMTPTEFVDKATKIHHGKFDYSKTKFENVKSNVLIICPIHGEFVQMAKTHLEGAGCLQCKYDNQRLGLEEFINRSSKIHQSRYDYTNVKYVDNHTNVSIICPIHGEFTQQPRTHMKGHGCPHCSKWVSVDELEFLSKIGVPLRPENRQVRIGKYFVDGLHDGTIFEFLGDYWHGNPDMYDPMELNKQVNKTHGTLYKNTIAKFETLSHLGYSVKYIWERDWKRWKLNQAEIIPMREHQPKKLLADDLAVGST